ncbi:MAG: ribosome recycling factor [Parcubacteria group bacterium LiPW_41]|nr:MAG: ribosome recycling factor [Parcubacteria group bacterium LiPW_41]
MHQSLIEFKETAKKIVEDFKKEISGVRANRPSAALIEEIKVIYYGNPTPLKHVGTISVLPPRELQVQFWDKEAVAPSAKAIESSALGLTPNIEGNTIRIFLPELSSERRDELAKYAKKISEEYRISLRHSRDEANKGAQAAFDEKEIGEDMKFKLKEEIQKQTEETNKLIEEVLDKKIAEIHE